MAKKKAITQTAANKKLEAAVTREEVETVIVAVREAGHKKLEVKALQKHAALIDKSLGL